MRLEQETYINPARLNFLSLPNGEETKGADGQRTYLYALGTIEQKSAHGLRKRKPQATHTKPSRLEPNPESKNGKKPAAKFEWPGQKTARLAREPKVREEEREVFVIKFSSIIISQIANNPEDDFYHATNLDKDLEAFLKRINPDFREIIGGDSPEYLRDFSLNALLTKFTEWWNVENPRNIPVLEKLAVENIIKLKLRGLNIQDVLNQVAEHFKFPIASADLPKPKKIKVMV